MEDQTSYKHPKQAHINLLNPTMMPKTNNYPLHLFVEIE